MDRSPVLVRLSNKLITPLTFTQLYVPFMYIGYSRARLCIYRRPRV